jgi:hypothetical protein
MVADQDAIPSRSLQDSLAQLAQSFQAHEETTPVSQISECLKRLSTSDRSALDRLFSLIHQNMVRAADDYVAPRQMPDADSDLIGTDKHQWPAYPLNRTNVCTSGSWLGWSAPAARTRARIGVAGKRTFAK